jgi:hypothetical protein
MKKQDFILIGALFFVAIAILLVFELGKEDGASVKVYCDNVEIAEYPLSKDGVYSLNGGTNTLKIENGQAFMVDANCPTLGNTKCTKQGKISKVGQRITCVHNEIEVVVVGAQDSDIDLIS